MLTREQLLNKEIILARKAFFSVGLTGNAGANLCLEVFLKGKLDPSTELCVNLTDVDKGMKAFVGSVDHKHIGKDLLPTWVKESEKYEGLDDLQALLLKACETLKPLLTFKYAELEQVRIYFGQNESLSARLNM